MSSNLSCGRSECTTGPADPKRLGASIPNRFTPQANLSFNPSSNKIPESWKICRRFTKKRASSLNRAGLNQAFRRTAWIKVLVEQDLLDPSVHPVSEHIVIKIAYMTTPEGGVSPVQVAAVWSSFHQSHPHLLVT